MPKTDVDLDELNLIMQIAMCKSVVTLVRAAADGALIEKDLLGELSGVFHEEDIE